MTHDVKFTIPTRTLGKTDISFVVRTDGEILGTLEVSRGGLEWFSKGAVNGQKITWKKFNDFAKNQK